MKKLWIRCVGSVLALSMFCAGCESDYPAKKFQIIDSNTRKPLAGVEVTQENILSKDMIFGMRTEFIVYHSNADGLVTTKPLPPVETTFSFELAGYEITDAMPTQKGMQIWGPVKLDSNDEPTTQYSGDDLNIIPMYPKSAAPPR